MGCLACKPRPGRLAGAFAWLLASALLLALTVFAAPARAAFGVEEKNFEAGTCTSEKCTYKTVEEHHSEAYTQSAGHPPFGITTFTLKESGGAPEGKPLKRVRVDVPSGLAADPQALPKCSQAEFKEDKCSVESQVGTDELKIHLATDVEVTGKVYNLEPAPGLPLEFGIHIEIEIAKVLVDEHVYLEGHVSWAKERRLEERGIPSGDYHEWFEINNISEKIPVVKSKLNFKGQAGKGDFLTLPSACSSSTTSYLEVESWERERATTLTHTPVGVEGCGSDPFAPIAEVTPQTSQSDMPDGVGGTLKLAQYEAAAQIDSADLRATEVTLPEGLTLNPAAAAGLEACTPTEIAIGSEAKATCPAAAKLGTVTIETDLPAGSLTGNVYLGNPSGGAITGPPFTVYLNAESERYGVSVRLSGLVYADPGTGRLTVTFPEGPQLPFSELALKMNGGPQAPLANPLVCGSAQVVGRFTPFTGLGAALSSTPFATGGCLSPLPFALTQTAQNGSVGAGTFTSYTFNVMRADGQQYLSQVSTLLPAGLSGLVPAVQLCGEPQAQEGTCSAASQIGTATAQVGSGPEPISFTGPVYLTGPYSGAPFGLSIPIAAVAGPFNFGTIVTRTAIRVDPHTARVSATGGLPTIVRGVPVRLRGLSVSVNRPNFLVNPTNCGLLATETTLTSTFGATQLVSTPFQVSNCEQLAFSPSLSVSTSADFSKADGASLEVTLTQAPHEANVRSITVQLPKQLPSRLTTLQQACPEATFAANPYACSAGSNVGSASAVTPVLPGIMSGPAYLVSHGGAAFPDLDVLLEASGVRVILVGSTDIQNGITTTRFSSLPDVPVSSFTLDLPTGPHSALAANGKLCGETLELPTTITSQNGVQVSPSERITVAGCAASAANKLFRILKRKIVGHKLLLRIRTLVPGKLSAKGKYLTSASRKLKKRATITLTMPLTKAGLAALRRHRPLKIRVTVTLVPSRHGEKRASQPTNIAFKR